MSQRALTDWVGILGLMAVFLPVELAQAAPPDVPHPGGDCTKCHTTDSWEVRPDKIAFDHAQTGFALRGRHVAAKCTDCHGVALQTREARRECRSCHTDPHRGTNGAACDRCHTPDSWRQSPGFLQHRAYRFPLVGTHAIVDCTACHRRGRQEQWQGVPTDCYGCHQKQYTAATTRPNHLRAGFRQDCDACHSQYLWNPARVRHEIFWPLGGAHAAADCFQCHKNERFGGTPTECFACHQAQYQAATNPPHAAYRMSRACQQCHNDESWKPVRATWHDAAFPIHSGKHAGFDCGQCHFGNALPPANFSCMACHQRSATTAGHDDVDGFVYENFACYGCHPRGEE